MSESGYFRVKSGEVRPHLPGEPRRKKTLAELEAELFRQVASTGPRRPQNGDSSHVPGKVGL